MEDRICACGCGEPVLAKRSNARFASKACSNRYWNKSEKGRESKCRWRAANREYGRRYYAANREKKREYYRRWRADNWEKNRERLRRWRAANPEKARECERRYRVANREKILKQTSEYVHRLRLQALAAVGGKCVWPGCGITDERLLTIDHPNGDGAIERRNLKSRIAFYKKVIEDPTRYQCLCHNHNWQKALENGEIGRRKAQPSHLPTVNLNEERKAS